MSSLRSGRRKPTDAPGTTTSGTLAASAAREDSFAVRARQLDPAGLKWHPDTDGFTAPGYLIRPSDFRPGSWRLESTDTRGWRGSRVASTSLHPSLPAAMGRARRDENERIRHDQVRGHLIVAGVSALLCTAFLTQIVSTGAFFLSMVFLYAATASFADAASVAWGDAWNWTQESTGAERLGWTDRFIRATMARLRARHLETLRQDPPSAIIMLPPPGDTPGSAGTSSRATIRR